MRIFLSSFVWFWIVLSPQAANSAEPLEHPETSSIQYTGIASLDLLVRDLRLLDRDLAQLEAAVDLAENQIKRALDAPENMSLEDAMTDFQQQKTKGLQVVWVNQSMEAKPVDENNEISTKQAKLINEGIQSLHATKEQLSNIPSRFSDLQPELNRVRTGAAVAGREALLNTRQRIELIDQIQHNESVAAGFSPRASAAVRHANLILYHLDSLAQ